MQLEEWFYHLRRRPATFLEAPSDSTCVQSTIKVKPLNCFPNLEQASSLHASYMVTGGTVFSVVESPMGELSGSFELQGHSFHLKDARRPLDLGIPGRHYRCAGRWDAARGDLTIAQTRFCRLHNRLRRGNRGGSYMSSYVRSSS